MHSHLLKENTKSLCLSWRFLQEHFSTYAAVQVFPGRNPLVYRIPSRPEFLAAAATFSLEYIQYKNSVANMSSNQLSIHGKTLLNVGCVLLLISEEHGAKHFSSVTPYHLRCCQNSQSLKLAWLHFMDRTDKLPDRNIQTSRVDDRQTGRRTDSTEDAVYTTVKMSDSSEEHSQLPEWP